MANKTILAVLALGISLLAASPTIAACTVPNTITNGQVADASKVMGNFTALANCVSAAGSANSVQINGGSGTLAGVGPLTAGQVLAGSAGAPQAATLVAGSGISIMNGTGAITISQVGTGSAAPIVSGLPTARPASTSFVWRNQGSASYIDHPNGPITISVPAQGHDQIRGLEQAVQLTPPYALTAKIDLETWNSDFYTAGIYVIDSSGKLTTLDAVFSQQKVEVVHWGDVASYVSTVYSGGVVLSPTLWFRVKNDGSTWSFMISRNGSDWIQLYSEDIAAYLGSSITAMGVYGNNNDTKSIGMPSKVSVWSFALEAGSGTDSHW